MKKSIFSAASMKVIIPILILVVAAGAYFVVNHLDNRTVYEDGEAFNPEFEEDQARESSEAGAIGGIEIPGYSEIVIPAGQTTVDVNFYNPETNNVYFEINLILAETEEEIYKSKLLSPGQHLYEIELERALESGQYDMVITYNTYSIDEEYTPKNGATVNCVLVVE